MCIRDRCKSIIQPKHVSILWITELAPRHTIHRAQIRRSRVQNSGHGSSVIDVEGDGCRSTEKPFRLLDQNKVGLKRVFLEILKYGRDTPIRVGVHQMVGLGVRLAARQNTGPHAAATVDNTTRQGPPPRCYSQHGRSTTIY